MAKTQIKTFKAANIETIESRVNDWLFNNEQNIINAVDIDFKSQEWIAVILYTQPFESPASNQG